MQGVAWTRESKNWLARTAKLGSEKRSSGVGRRSLTGPRPSQIGLSVSEDPHVGLLAVKHS